jgi:hypothetical protein
LPRVNFNSENKKMVKHRTAIVIDETQFALLVAGAAVCVMTPFADVEIRLSSTKPCVWHQGRAADPFPDPPPDREFLPLRHPRRRDYLR